MHVHMFKRTDVHKHPDGIREIWRKNQHVFLNAGFFDKPVGIQMDPGTSKAAKSFYLLFFSCFLL